MAAGLSLGMTGSAKHPCACMAHTLPHPFTPPTPGLHHEVALLPGLVQLNSLGDDVLVTALEAQVLTAQRCDELSQAIAKTGKGHGGGQ